MSIKVTYFVAGYRCVTWGIFASCWDAVDWAQDTHGATAAMAVRTKK